MTLQQAHELQRREPISLRAKVARLEKQTSGLLPVEEKEALERRVHHLEQINKTEKRRHEEARAHWKLMESIKYNLELENLELKEQLAAALSVNKLLRQRAEKAEAKVAMLNGTNAKLPATKEPVIIPVSDAFTSDPNLYPTGKKIIKQLIDISISVNVTDYITDDYRNRKTGARCHTRLEPDVMLLSLPA